MGVRDLKCLDLKSPSVLASGHFYLEVGWEVVKFVYLGWIRTHYDVSYSDAQMVCHWTPQPQLPQEFQVSVYLRHSPISKMCLQKNKHWGPSNSFCWYLPVVKAK